MKNRILYAFLAFFFMNASGFARFTDTERMHRLTGHLQSLHDDSRTGRHIGGGVLLGLAGASTVGAILSSNAIDPDMRKNGPLTFGIAAGIFGLTGSLLFFLRSDEEIFYDQYQLMSESNAHQISEKANRGEMYLEKLARSERQTRYVSGSIAATLGVAQLALYLASNNQSGNSYLLYNGILFTGISLADFFITRPAENEAAAYDQWREKHAQHIQFKWYAFPTTEGLQTGIAMRF